MPARWPAAELDILQFEDAAAWSSWLEEHHADSPGVWLKLAKKGSPASTLTYREAVDEALCYGWIDSQMRGLDDHFWLQRFTPRRPRSKWSQINRERVAELIEQGRMKPSGLAQVEAARADGRFDDAYEPQRTATVPEDLQQALEANPAAAEFFATLTGARRYAFLHRLHHVRSPERRAERIAHYIELLEQGRMLN